MTTPPTVDTLPPEVGAALVDFARACKAAARAVSLYPATHPTIQSSLSRVSSAIGRLTTASTVTLTVLPDQLVLDGRVPPRPDPALAELASLMHVRLVASLRIEGAATPEDWRAFLLLLGRPPEDLIADGGIARAWGASGQRHFEIQQIDYADVLREREDGEAADWDQIIAHCVRGQALDDRQLSLLLETFSDPARLADFLARLEGTEGSGGPSLTERAAALLHLVHQLLGTVKEPRDADRLLQTVAAGTARLTPEMVLALLDQARAGGAMQETMGAILARIGDDTVASFVAHAVSANRAASERLAQAFHALVPDTEDRSRILTLAHAEAAGTPLGADGSFEEVWHSAADMLTSYSDRTYVSGDYGRQLSAARTKAVEVERVSDDPPERLRAWLTTVSDTAVRQLDLDLLLDLLRIEADPEAWRTVAHLGLEEAERRTAAGDLAGAVRLIEGIAGLAASAGNGGRPEAARALLARAAEGPLVSSLVSRLREVPDGPDVTAVARLFAALPAPVVRPLAEALAAEDDGRTARRLREVLLGFGSDGAQAIEQLRKSPNAQARRVAIELMRQAGGGADIATLLNDGDAQVRLEATRALIAIDTNDARAVLERALAHGGPAAHTLLQQVMGLKDDRAAPLLAGVLAQSEPRGSVATLHAQLIEVIGGLRAHPESVRALKLALYRGQWWAPLRTAALRRAAAAALRRLNSPESLAVLEEAASRGAGGVRKAAMTQLAGRAARP